MSLQAPIKRILLDRPAADNNNEMWEISAPEKNCLYWSILVPYLIASSKLGDFIKNLELVIGSKKEAESIQAKFDKTVRMNFGMVNKRITNINPFKNIHTLYRDDNLILLMRIFKLRLNRLADERKKNGATYDDILKIDVASDTLKCQIDVYEGEIGCEKKRSFSPKVSSFPRGNQSILAIFKHFESGKDIYKFGITEDHSDKMRAGALEHILGLAKIDKNQISKILDKASGAPLLHALLQTIDRDTVCKLYEYTYFIRKLSDAGFEMDPLSESNDGFSAFYYCLLRNEWKLFCLLYNYVTKRDYSSDPECCLIRGTYISKLEKIKEILENDIAKHKQLLRRGSELVKMYKLILQYNSYQLEIEKEIALICQSNEESCVKTRNILIFIIDKYHDYFFLDDQKDECHQFEDYFQNYEYYQMLDDYTALCFYDNFYSRTFNVGKDEKIFIEVLVSLFMYFIIRDTYKDFQPSNSDVKIKAIYYIIFCYRHDWKQSLDTLRSHVRNSSSGEKVKSPMKIFENCLDENPLIKEELLITKLKYYFDLCNDVSFSNGPTKAAFVVERVLQAIGEILCAVKDTFTVTPLLQFVLPRSTYQAFCDIRNHHLSHYRATSVSGRRALESGEYLKEIQGELKELAKIFEPIYYLQAVRIKEHVISRSTKRKFNKDIYSNFGCIKTEIIKLKEKLFSKYKENYINIASKFVYNLIEKINKGSRSKLGEISNSVIFLLKFISENSGDNQFILSDTELNEVKMLLSKNADESDSHQSSDRLFKMLCTLKKYFEDNVKRYKSLDVTDFSKLDELPLKIKKYDVFNSEEKERIRKSLEDVLETPRKARQLLEDHIMGNIELPPSEINDRINELLISHTEKKFFKANLMNANESLIKLKSIRDTVMDILGNEDETSYNLMCILDNHKDVIKNLCLPKSLHDKIGQLKAQKLDFVLERMRQLEEILIMDDEYISNLRKYGSSAECKEHTKYLMMQRFLEEKQTKAASEMLLLDCLEIFNKREDFRHMWTKKSNLFYGINLRDILAHGCPIVEVSNSILDSFNLPMEFINTSLTLIDDRKALEALVEICDKMNYPKNKELLELINQNNPPRKYTDLIKTVKKCKTWENYLFLITKW